MIVRTTDEITGTDRDVTSENGNWTSKRIILAGDGVGFSFHETVIQPGTVNEFHYANHVEAVWLVEGEGTLTDRETGDQYPLAPGTMYLLNGHERHTVQPRRGCGCCACSIPRSPGVRCTTRTASTRLLPSTRSHSAGHRERRKCASRPPNASGIR